MNSEKISQQRYGEIDTLRAAAIVLMVIFHLVYDLREFAGMEINCQAPLWSGIGKASALLFIFVSGISSGFSRSPVKRGLRVLFWGMVVTAVTYLMLRQEYVRFGILHFLGVAMILAPIFFPMPKRILGGLAVFSVGLGFWFKGQAVQTALLLPLGLMYEGYETIDYYPLFPYLAATMVGIITYKLFYAQDLKKPFSSRFKFGSRSNLIQWLSRRSLGIYLIHQPIILGIIFAANWLVQ